jgi:hypothetical protein
MGCLDYRLLWGVEKLRKWAVPLGEWQYDYRYSPVSNPGEEDFSIAKEGWVGSPSAAEKKHPSSLRCSDMGPMRVRMKGSLRGGKLSVHQEDGMVWPAEETGKGEERSSSGARLRVQLGPVVGAQLSLSMDERGWLRCPADSLREGGIMPMSDLVGHGFVFLTQTWYSRWTLRGTQSSRFWP